MNQLEEKLLYPSHTQMALFKAEMPIAEAQAVGANDGPFLFHFKARDLVRRENRNDLRDAGAACVAFRRRVPPRAAIPRRISPSVALFSRGRVGAEVPPLGGAGLRWKAGAIAASAALSSKMATAADRPRSNFASGVAARSINCKGGKHVM